MAESHSEDLPLLGATDPPSPGGVCSPDPGGNSPSWQRPYTPLVENEVTQDNDDEEEESAQRLNVPARAATPKSVYSQTSMDSGCECDPSEGESNSSQRDPGGFLNLSRQEPGPSGLTVHLVPNESSDCHCGGLNQRCACRLSQQETSVGDSCKDLVLTHTDRGELQTPSCKVSFCIGYEENDDLLDYQGCSSSAFSTNIIESTSQSGSEPGDEFKELVRSAPKSFPRVTSYSKTGMLSASSSTASMPMCRICHFPQGDDMLISPCRCAGTMQFIHESCLSRWLEISSKRKKRATCELCYYQFNRHKKFKLRHWQLPSCSRLDKILHSIFLTCLLVMATCATITIYCFKQDRFVKKREDTDLTQSEIVTLTCGVLFFVAFFMAMYVEVKAKDTLYKLFSKFLYLNQTWHIDEYDKGKDRLNEPV